MNTSINAGKVGLSPVVVLCGDAPNPATGRGGWLRTALSERPSFRSYEKHKLIRIRRSAAMTATTGSETEHGALAMGNILSASSQLCEIQGRSSLNQFARRWKLWDEND